MKYKVFMVEKWRRPVIVDADSPEEARENAFMGEYDLNAPQAEFYDIDLDYEEWQVEEIK